MRSSPMTRRLVETFALLLFASIATVAHAKGRPLIVYSPHGPEILKLAKAELQKEIPDADVEWQFLGAEEIYAKIAQQDGRTPADLWWGGPQFTFIQAAAKNLFVPYKPSWSAAVTAADHDDQDFWYGDMQTPLSIFYAKDAVKPADLPADWDDLLSPKFTGKLVVRYPMESGTMRALYAALIERQLAKKKSLPEALQWMARLDKQVAQFVPHSKVMFSAVAKGVTPYGFWNVAEIAMKGKQGFPVETVFPSSGMPILLDCIALLRRVGTEHPYARKFYEIVTSKTFAEKLVGAPFFRAPVRTDMAANIRPAYLDDKRFKVMPVDWRRVAAEGSDWLKSWDAALPAAQKPAPSAGAH